ncbi:Calx-beta domain-containing protein [Montanilutibacter psychrotolerans]|nr:Calx-beta domain-containing protein [Lysobacter psychrotolerans]
MRPMITRLLLTCTLGLLAAPMAMAQQCPSSVPVQGAPVPPPLPLFPADNWWNTDIRSAPVDPSSANFIAFINNGGTRRLHPDFGGEEEPGSESIYGFPYAIVNGSQPKKAVTFNYWDESDGVDQNTGQGVPFYPIPIQAITQPHWIEGGAPGNVDQRSGNDRHLLIVDCTNRHLYELYNVYYNPTQARWHGGSGAFFDMNRNDRRPETWTSADAAGLAIFPGLVRYDEAANPAVAEINHALRVTVRASNGYVYPASHEAGDTPGALPMGARLRLKATVNGVDPATRTTDPVARKIFRAMQKYGLIVADNGTDMYISGTFDVRWDNGLLNPAFRTLNASDFEVIQRGWKPVATPVLSAVSASPSSVFGGQSATGTVTLGAAAPSGGARVTLASASPAFAVPPNVTVAAGARTATFPITTQPSTVTASGTLSATYAGVTRTTTFTVNATPPTLSIGDVAIAERDSATRIATFTVRLSRASNVPVGFAVATANGTALAGSDYVARSLTGQSIPAGATTATFDVTIIGDTVVEANEVFTANLSAPVGATIADGQATASIVNDDGPTLSIGNVSIAEGNAGTSILAFTVMLSRPATTAITFNIATANSTAVAGTDYVARSVIGRSIPAGYTSSKFTVAINGDTTVEASEIFLVNLTGAVGATIYDRQAIGTIGNDD